MPFTNFESRHFTAAEKTTINAAMAALETALAPKTANLDAEERQQYGSVNEKNKLIINKVKDYHNVQPELSSDDVDWAEFINDYDSRSFLQTMIQRLRGLEEGLDSAKLLHDWDNYQAALTDYDYAKFKASRSATSGYKTKVEEIAQFFTGGSAPDKKEATN